MRILNLVLGVALVFGIIEQRGACQAASECEQRCGSKTVPYPFGFSSRCPKKLNCSGSGEILVGEHGVANISEKSIELNASEACTRNFRIPKEWIAEYGLTTRNIIQLGNCSDTNWTCIFNVTSLLRNTLYDEQKPPAGQKRPCDFSALSCVRNSSDEDFIPWSYFQGNRSCRMSFTGIVVDPTDDLLLNVRFGIVDLGWCLEGPCKCAKNSLCVNLTSPLNGNPCHRCSCLPGFVGDGYEHGSGCVEESSQCSAALYLSEGCDEATRLAIIVGVTAVGICTTIVVILLCSCYRIKNFRRKRIKNEQELLSLQAGSLDIPTYAYKDLEKATQGFSDKALLGNGGSGAVYLGKLSDDTQVAVKKLRNLDATCVSQMINEIKLLSSLNHPNLVRLKGICIKNDEPILVYEYMPNGTLQQHLSRERGEGLSWKQRITLASETAEALAYLHSSISPPIYHRDVKSSNILLDYNYRSKLGDLGLSKIAITDSSHISTAPQGTPGYLDPQYHQNFHLSDKSDVYSFGVVLVEIISGLKAVDFSRCKSEINLAFLATDRIGSGRIDDMMDTLLHEEAQKNPRVRTQIHAVAELAFRCLAFDSATRPSMREVASELAQVRRCLCDTSTSHTLASILEIKGRDKLSDSPVSVEDRWIGSGSCASSTGGVSYCSCESS